MSLFGRRVIYTKETAVTASNVVDVLNETRDDFIKNRTEAEDLLKYFKGNQPILRRKKDVRPEICNKIVENRANEIVAFKTGYLCGEPIQYISRSAKSGVAKNVGRLNDAMLVESKATKDKDLVEWMHIAGHGYRIVLTSPDGSESPFELHTLAPSEAYVIRSRKIRHKVLAGVHCGVDADGTEVFTVYTDREFFEVKGREVTRVQAHALGAVPIVEYPLNNSRLGAFEPVIPILDAINTVTSNRLDGVEQFVQSLMKFINCEVDKDTIKELMQMGAIQIKSTDGQHADVEIMTQELNQQQTQTLVDHMYQTVLTICGMPNRNGNGSSTSDTGAASLLRDGWTLAEARAKDAELMFKASEQEMLKVVLRICGGTSDISLGLRDIDIKFTRRNYENIQTKAQVLCEMLNNDKIDPKLAFTHCGMFTDPEEAYTVSMKWFEEQQKKLEKEKKIEAADSREDTAEKLDKNPNKQTEKS